MRGRSIVALALLGFVLVATGVIWRRSAGITRAREESRLDQQRAALEAERAKLEGDIRDASSRARLARIAEERLHMHIPNDSQVIYLAPSARKAKTGDGSGSGSARGGSRARGPGGGSDAHGE
ncbi:MAG: cell division protein FtsL [Gemmatimonadetes bacterium]|nr:cell division protein FtsL [Gemmatimonadota bacterium]